MKKVCIVTTVHPVFDIRIFQKEAKTLLANGFDVTLIIQHTRNEVVNGIKIIALPLAKNRFYRFLLGKLAYKLALSCAADIYHFHDPELIPWMLKLKKKTKAKIIYDVHENVKKDILSKMWIPGFIRKPISFLFDWYEKWTAKKMNYIIAATPDIANSFHQKNVVQIRNYPIITDNSLNVNQHNGSQRIELIYVGALTKIKGIREIVEATQQINQKYCVHLKLIGVFSEKDFEQEINKIIDCDKIEILGFKSQDAVYLEMRKADIGLVCFWPEPNHIEAMPNKIFEYMSVGLPIIASRFPLWLEIIEKGGCGLTVDPLNSREISEAIEYLIEHPEERKEMGDKGKKLVMAQYNWDNESRKLLEVYRNL